MRHWTLLPIVLLALAVAIGGCGESQAGPETEDGTDGIGTPKAPGGGQPASIPVKTATVTVENDLGRLVPENAVAIVYVPSLATAVDEVKKLVAAANPQFADEVDVNMLLGEMLGMTPGLTPEMIDPTKPMALVVMMPPGGGPTEPIPAIILCVRDPKAAAESMANPPACAGSFIAFAPMGGVDLKAANTVPDIAKGLAGGDLAVRLDLAKITSVYGDTLKMGLGQGMSELQSVTGPDQPDISGFTDVMQKGLGDLIDSVDVLNLALNIDGATVTLNGGLMMKAGSPLAGVGVPAGDLAAMAGMLPGDYPISMLLSLDWTKVMAWMQPLMDISLQTMPENLRSEFTKQWAKVTPLFAHLGNDIGVAASLGPDGMQLVEILSAKDAKGYLDGMEALMKGGYGDMMAGMGMSMTLRESVDVAGFEVRGFGMTIDPKKFMEMSAGGQELPPEATAMMEQMLTTVFGKDGMAFHMADVNGTIVAMMGDDAALERTIKHVAGGGRRNDSLTTALQMAGSNPGFLMRLEIRTLIRQVMAVMRKSLPPEMTSKMPLVPAGAPIPFSIGYGVSGLTHCGGFSIDAGALAGLIQALDK
jgi:hypothetical protein